MLVFRNVYRNVTEALAAEIRLLWIKEGAVSDEQIIRERLEQVVFVIVHTETGRVGGVSTAVKKKVNALNGNFLYEFRCYLREDCRVAGVDVKLSRLTFDFLGELAGNDPEKPIGIFAVLGNKFLQMQPVWRRAVWPELNMHFIGYNKTGDPIRVHYFNGARI